MRGCPNRRGEIARRNTIAQKYTNVYNIRVMATSLPPTPARASALERLLTSSHVRWGLWIFAAAFILRVAWVMAVNPEPFGTDYPDLSGAIADEIFYFGSAKSLAAGDGFRDPLRLEYSTRFPPGYPLSLASLFLLTGSEPVVAKIFNIFAGATGAVLVYAIAARALDQRAAVVAGVLMALFPSQVFFTTVVMTETFFVALSAALVLLLTVWLAGTGRMKGWQVLALGLLLGFMSLVRVEALLLAPATAVLWKICGQSWRVTGCQMLVLLAGMAILIGPWTARNYARFDEVVLISGRTGGPLRVLRIGFSPDYDNHEKYRLFRAEPMTFGELVNHYGTHPQDIFTVGARKISGLFENDDHLRWIQAFHQPKPLSKDAESRWSTVANVWYYIVGGAALLGAPLWFSLRDRRVLVLLWFLTSWSLIHLLLVPEVRYHFAIIPVVCVLAALGVVGVRDRLARA